MTTTKKPRHLRRPERRLQVLPIMRATDQMTNERKAIMWKVPFRIVYCETFAD